MSQCTKALDVLFNLRQLRIEGGNFVFTTKADNGPQQIIARTNSFPIGDNAQTVKVRHHILTFFINLFGKEIGGPDHFSNGFTQPLPSGGAQPQHLSCVTIDGGNVPVRIHRNQPFINRTKQRLLLTDHACDLLWLHAHHLPTDMRGQEPR